MLLPTIFAAFLLSTQHKPADKDTASVRAMYPRIERIFVHKDWRDAARIIADDYTEDTADHKKENKKSFLAEKKAATAGWHDVKADVQPVSIEIAGGKATVEVRYLVTAKFNDKAGKHSIRFEGSEVHRWRKTHGHWLLAYIKEHEYSVTIDGKVVQHAP